MPSAPPTPLTNNSGHVASLCDRLGLGIPEARPGRVFGGFHHKMWRLDTDRGSYAVKQLCPDTDLGDPDTVRHYDTTERIAESFVSHNVKSVVALKHRNQYLQLIDGTGYLVYPWIEAQALAEGCIDPEHAVEVARTLAIIHCVRLQAPELADTAVDLHSEENIVELVRCAKAFHGELAEELERRLGAFVRIAKSQRSAQALLARHTVISHGDLDHKNVLWDAEGTPHLIDWECARRLNPTYELLLEALDWSAVTSHMELSVFELMLAAYCEAGGEIEAELIDPAFRCLMGDWVNWLMYNVGRSINPRDPDECATGVEQVRLSLVTISRLQDLTPDLLSIVWRQVAGRV